MRIATITNWAYGATVCLTLASGVVMLMASNADNVERQAVEQRQIFDRLTEEVEMDAWVQSDLARLYVINKDPESLNEYPVVMVDATDHENKVPSIEPDEFMIGYDATNRLIQAGCKRIAYVGCAENMIAQDGRLAGYRTALQEAGRAFNPSLVCNVMNNGPALRAVNKLFDDEHPDGFFCFNDARAWYVYECAARRGLTVGKDISVVGVDNHRVFAETLEPQLTTVELPHYEMGYWSACKLISMIEGKDVDTSSCPSARASLPPLDAPIPAKIHCALLEKDSVIS